MPMKRILLEIHQTRRFRKQLQTMEKAGKNERIAVKRAEDIIASLQRDPLHGAAENRRTHHGELRLRDCRKYDLSCGFRLIGLKRDSRLIFTCIGSHDDCQRWIENNRKDPEDIESVPIPRCRCTDHQDIFPGNAEPEIDEYEEQLKGRIDEQLLCEIFAGLCKNSKPNTGEIG